MAPLLPLLALLGSGAAIAEAPPRTRFARVGESLPMTERSIPSPRWYLLAPLPLDYDNTSCGQRCVVPIVYAWRELPALRGLSAFDARDVPELASPGTHRLLARAEAPTAPPGASDLAAAWELVVRRDDSYAGYASELIGVPFVLFPRHLPDGRHQTDARLGADCVALTIYGRRRLGEAMPYVAPSALHRFTWRVTGPVRAGDVLHFGFQTAVLAEDRAPMGVLDAGDLILHTFHGLAEERSLGDVPYHSAPYEVRRWKPSGPGR
ncbi:hypothetical protein [Pyxidicoccus caerfyrddinensis]|uniref:hypothetical protein n=1 Tax=Pyxidicoccus caerfyrddinensis TaxID=2709663 RepID=UPI0013DC94FB|nr:hypothetical protein [Pyxidicoccus caerfyrddinensis]